MPYVCDGNSAGALLSDPRGRVLLGKRAQDPAGIAPPAGHVTDDDPHRTHRQAAVDETAEEYGLTVDPGDLTPVYERWHPNRCGAQVPAPHLGHHWQVFRALRWSGRVVLAPEEVASYAWYEPAQVQYLAERTIAYAHGALGEAEWASAPGLEPVWVDMLAQTPRRPGGLAETYIRVPDPVDLRAVRALYTAAPA